MPCFLPHWKISHAFTFSGTATKKVVLQKKKTQKKRAAQKAFSPLTTIIREMWNLQVISIIISVYLWIFKWWGSYIGMHVDQAMWHQPRKLENIFLHGRPVSNRGSVYRCVSWGDSGHRLLWCESNQSVMPLTASRKLHRINSCRSLFNYSFN